MATLRIRKYPHFDGDLKVEEAESLVNDPEAVSRHAFFPFIEAAQHWTRFSDKGVLGKAKDRPIRYPARADACIYSRYRALLVERYEARLSVLSVGDSVLAYRRIPKSQGSGHKSNIDFANDVFYEITAMGSCFAYALDIKGFFENIDHDRLKTVWCELLEENRLPSDHHQVFKSITKYAWVDKTALYTKLGFIGKVTSNGQTRVRYTVKRIPLQVCSGKVFRERICALIKRNPDTRGIPQGSPMSDILANLYLLDFDIAMNNMVKTCGGKYYRYSDDILILIPGSQDDIHARLNLIQDLLSGCGKNLQIKAEKSSVFRFTKKSVDDAPQVCELLHGTQGKNGLEYLGFRFDGRNVYIRDSTLAGLNRKIVASAKKLARIHAELNPTLSVSDLKKSFKYNRVIEKFGRIDDFDIKQITYKDWTFWTYAIRASKAFGPKGKPVLRQLRAYKRFVRHRCDEALARYKP